MFGKSTAYAGDAVWEKNGGIYLGKMVEPERNERDFPLEPSDDDAPFVNGAGIKSSWPCAGGDIAFTGNRHLLTVGPNGSGKSRKLLLVNLFRLRDWSCVVVDPKGELCAHTAVWRASRKNHKVVVVDPFGVMEKSYPRLFAKHGALLKSHGFNPLAGVDPESLSFIDDVRKIATALVRTDNARDPYWAMAAQVLIKGVIMGLKAEYGPKADLTLLRQVLGATPAELAAYCQEQIKDFGTGVEALAASLNEFTKYSPDDRELSGIRRTAQFHTEWLDSKLMKADLNWRKGVIDTAALKKTPTTIYLVLPPKELVEKATWLRMMITSLLMPLMDSVEPAPVPVLFMLDEAAALGRLEIIENNYALLRQYGVKFWTVWQGLSQAKLLYREWWENLLANAGATQAFAPQDLTTRDYLSKLGGERIKRRETYQRSRSKNTSSGYSDGESYGSSGEGTGSGGNQKGWNKGGNKGKNWSEGKSESENWGEQFANERRAKPHELAALEDDETVIFYRDGDLYLSICPQPEHIPGVAAELRKAQQAIKG